MFGTRRQRVLFVAALLIAAVVIAAREVLLPFVLASVIAYVLLPLVQRLERRGMKRGLAIVLVYVAVIGSLAGFLRLSAPRIAGEVRTLVRELPRIVRDVQQEYMPKLNARLASFGVPKDPDGHDTTDVEPEDATMVVRPRKDGSYGVELRREIVVQPGEDGRFVITDPDPREAAKTADDLPRKAVHYVRKNIAEVIRGAQAIVKAGTRGVFVFSITLMIAAYLMLTKERIMGFFRDLVLPENRLSWDRLLVQIDRGLSGVVRGQLVICLVNGSLTAVGFALIHLKYWPVLALIATVFSLIPIFGAIISSVPAVLIGLTQGPGTGAFVLLWILGIHQLEANFLNPKIMGDAAKIHPVLVIFSLLVGEHLFHTVGALLAVPCMSIAQTLFLHFLRPEGSEDPPASGTEAPSASAPAAPSPDAESKVASDA
jgi:predicted PurR-regulated permease PerM